MRPERFRQIEELYHAAREGTPEARAELLAQIDPDLRRQVEFLLSQSGGEFLNRPAVEIAPGLLEETTVTRLAEETMLGPYRIESKLGQGGMGEVFRALDTRLGRAVAVKVTQDRFSARFEREARAIASLNHPHICTLHDVGPNYLVMELVEGETIAERLKSGALPVKAALIYASQIAAALAEAHSKGIVHRDLKPANIMLAKSGVKVLDFGLARSGQDATLTAPRMVLGTPAYMAPEQREGKSADARSDIYSFGCVLYEMFTGARFGAPRKRMPSPGLEKIVNRCLEENPERRWQSAAEVERKLAAVGATGSRDKLIFAAAVAVLGLFAIVYFLLPRASKLTAKDTLVLADFDNKTGDPVFDDTLRQGLSVELQQSPFLALIPDTKIQAELALMKQPKQARLTSELAQQVCERTASAAVLEGSIAANGSQYILGLQARNCSSGSILDQEQAVAARREDVLNALSQIARRFRVRVGESLATVEKHSTPLAEATTSSLEALKAYSTGVKAFQSSGNDAAIAHYKRAVEIDRTFAMAHAHLGLAYSAVGESVLSAEHTTEAWRLQDHVSARERYFISFTYFRQVKGNLEKAFETLEAWRQMYPRPSENPNPQGLLAGLSTHGTGRYDIAIKAALDGIAADPGSSIKYSNLAESYFLTDRFPEVEEILQRAAARKLETVDSLILLYNIAVLNGNTEQMKREVTLAKGKVRAEHWISHAEALALARSGQLQAARQSSNRAVGLARQQGENEAAESYLAAEAVWEALSGNADAGKSAAMEARNHSQGRDVQYAAGMALAFSGDTTQAEAIANDLQKRFPEDTFVKFTYVPVLRALVALNRGKPADALEQLTSTRHYELAANGLNFSHYYLGGLHSAYVRGEALWSLHRYAESAAEYQKILDHRGIVGLDPIGALAYLGLGKAYASAGDNSKAKSAYEGFFKLWNQPDKDVPILLQAQKEYAALR